MTNATITTDVAGRSPASVVMPSVVVFDCGEAFLYGRGPDGRVDYSDTVPWPGDWPPYITGRWLRDRGVPYTTA